MLSKEAINGEYLDKQKVNLESSALFTGTVDSWINNIAVGTNSSLSAVTGTGLYLKAAPTNSPNSSLEINTRFNIVPRLYKQVRIITVFDLVNVDFLTAKNAEVYMGLSTSDGNSSMLLKLHDQTLSAKVGGVQKADRLLMRTTDSTKRKTLEILWNTEDNYIDVFENHVFIYRFQGDELPDKALSYQFKQKIVSLTTTNDKVIQTRKLMVEYML